MADDQRSVQRATVALSVPSRGGEHSQPVSHGQWTLDDGFHPAVSTEAVSGMAPPQVLAAFLSSVSTDRVALHRALEDGFATAVTLADASAYSAFVACIKQHFSSLEQTARAMSTRLQESHAPLAALLDGVNKLEASRLELALQGQLVRQRISSAQFEADTELKAEAATISGKLNELSAEINEQLSELRAEAQDLD
eukprot:CAMPEP_0119406014 /NCGR_PEP_ID=MMETSP1335-20130426/505_1 /TAXON_ID=259385 /ORGANISM="Chrysoculter rhomboideus, Strain RCC1486" /LENGTH=195 /DNA_ID=CAMNT_0007430069 /DNA_START=33 /DNA_END=620 /DNA_ORIENTATION=+